MRQFLTRRNGSNSGSYPTKLEESANPASATGDSTIYDEKNEFINLHSLLADELPNTNSVGDAEGRGDAKFTPANISNISQEYKKHVESLQEIEDNVDIIQLSDSELIDEEDEEEEAKSQMQELSELLNEDYRKFLRKNSRVISDAAEVQSEEKMFPEAGWSESDKAQGIPEMFEQLKEEIFQEVDELQKKASKRLNRLDQKYALRDGYATVRDEDAKSTIVMSLDMIEKEISRIETRKLLSTEPSNGRKHTLPPIVRAPVVTGVSKRVEEVPSFDQTTAAVFSADQTTAAVPSSAQATEVVTVPYVIRQPSTFISIDTIRKGGQQHEKDFNQVLGNSYNRTLAKIHKKLEYNSQHHTSDRLTDLDIWSDITRVDKEMVINKCVIERVITIEEFNKIKERLMESLVVESGTQKCRYTGVFQYDPEGGNTFNKIMGFLKQQVSEKHGEVTEKTILPEISLRPSNTSVMSSATQLYGKSHRRNGYNGYGEHKPYGKYT